MATKRKLSPRKLTYANLIALGTLSQTEAYIQAGFSPRSAHVESSVALKDPRVIEAIATRKRSLQTQTDYSIQRWLADILEDIAHAQADSAHGAVMKGRELVGRHIGALNAARGVGESDQLYSFLSDVMQREYAAVQQSTRPVIELAARAESRGVGGKV